MLAEGGEAHLAALTALIDAVVARYEALPDRLREHASAACPPKLLRALGVIASSAVPDDGLDGLRVAEIVSCLEPARRLLRSGVGELVELQEQIEVKPAEARAMLRGGFSVF